MIRVFKNAETPDPLLNGKTYKDPEVEEQIFQDQNHKCYICERNRDTDTEVEHLKSRDNFPELENDWNNLFLGCGFCNKRKGSRYDDILDPSQNNIEEIIEQHLNNYKQRVEFKISSSLQTNDAIEITISLLNRIYNGKNGLRKKGREERFFNSVQQEINIFRNMINQWLFEKSEEVKLAIKEALQIDKNQLGLKYWIIQSNPVLKAEFSNDIIWNKK